MPSQSLSTQRRAALVGAGLIVLAATGFSSKSILIKLAYGDGAALDPITLMTLRMLFSLPFFLLAALWRPDTTAAKMRRLDWGGILLLGMLGYYLASLLDFSGLQYISAGLERLILFLYPTMVVLLTALLSRRWITPTQALALALSYGGIALVFVTEGMVTTTPDLTRGAALVFGSALVFALFMTGTGRLIPRIGARRFTAWSMSVACLITIAHFLLTHPVTDLLVSGRVLLLGLMLAAFATVLPAFLMNAGIGRIGASKAAIISAAGPIATLVMAWRILGEPLTTVQIVGALLVLSGVLVISLKKEAGAR